MPDITPREVIIPFWEELDQLTGRTILATWTDFHRPRLLLVFTDQTAAIVTEDLSDCYYAGDHGGMMVDDPYEDERAKAVEIWLAKVE